MEKGGDFVLELCKFDEGEVLVGMVGVNDFEVDFLEDDVELVKDLFLDLVEDV